MHLRRNHPSHLWWHMAKVKDTAPQNPGKMTIMVIQLEGSDATLQEGIRTFKEAMSRAMPQLATRPATFQPQLTSLAGSSQDAAGEIADSGDVREASFESQTITDSQTATTAEPKGKPKDRPFPTMQFVKDLNLHPVGKFSLKQFVDGKKPSNQQQRITVCLYYLCRVLELTGVTPNHIFTCLKHLNVKTPNDLPQEIRNIGKRKGYIDAANTSELKITNPGENFVEHELSSIDN